MIGSFRPASTNPLTLILLDGVVASASLSFLSDEAPSFNQNKMKIPCKEGDMLIFPSNLIHYTNDTFDKRIVMSANMYAGFCPNFLNSDNPTVDKTTGEE